MVIGYKFVQKIVNCDPEDYCFEMQMWNYDTKDGALPQEFSLAQGKLEILNFTDPDSKELIAVLESKNSPILTVKKSDAPTTKNYFFSTPSSPILQKANGKVYILSDKKV